MQMRLNIVYSPDAIADPRAHIYSTKSIGILIDHWHIYSVYGNADRSAEVYIYTYIHFSIAHTCFLGWIYFKVPYWKLEKRKLGLCNQC